MAGLKVKGDSAPGFVKRYFTHRADSAGVSSPTLKSLLCSSWCTVLSFGKRSFYYICFCSGGRTGIRLRDLVVQLSVCVEYTGGYQSSFQKAEVCGFLEYSVRLLWNYLRRSLFASLFCDRGPSAALPTGYPAWLMISPIVSEMWPCALCCSGPFVYILRKSCREINVCVD